MMEKKFDLIDDGSEEDAPEEGRATECWVEDDTREFDGQDDTREGELKRLLDLEGGAVFEKWIDRERSWSAKSRGTNSLWVLKSEKCTDENKSGSDSTERDHRASLLRQIAAAVMTLVTVFVSTNRGIL
jgi:hypothetical protein